MVVPQVRGQVPTIPWARITRTTDPKLRMPVPAMQGPVQNANILLNKSVLLLNRAGSDEANPILRGLGIGGQISLGLEDILQGVFIFQDLGQLGPNLLPSIGSGGPGIFTFSFQAGDGQSIAGTPATGAVRNYIRMVSSFGTVEREFWIKTYDADIIALNGQPALDPTTLQPVSYQVEALGGGQSWINIPIDFFLSWGDEFQVMNSLLNGTPANGSMKSYGGAAFVSFFDTSTHTQGVGIQVNPVTDAPIKDQHTIQVQNTAGTKLITVRFRSKAGSTWFVDVPISIVISSTPAGSCEPPVDQYCGQMLVKALSPLPINVQGSPSVPNVQDVLGTPGAPVDRDLLFLSVHGSIAGSTANLLIRKWKWIKNASDISGARLNQVGSDAIYLPVRTSALLPNPGGDYNPPQQLTVCMDVAADRAIGVAFYSVQIQDGHSLGPADLFTGPHAGDIAFFPAGGTGGSDACITY